MQFLKDFGALVTLILALLGGAMAYGALGNRVETLEGKAAKIDTMSEDIAVIKQMIKDMHDVPGAVKH